MRESDPEIIVGGTIRESSVAKLKAFMAAFPKDPLAVLPKLDHAIRKSDAGILTRDEIRDVLQPLHWILEKRVTIIGDGARIACMHRTDRLLIPDPPYFFAAGQPRGPLYDFLRDNTLPDRTDDEIVRGCETLGVRRQRVAMRREASLLVLLIAPRR